jgi:hypothetical protein
MNSQDTTGNLSTGIFSTKMMFDVLRENNMNEIAYRIADQRSFRAGGTCCKTVPLPCGKHLEISGNRAVYESSYVRIY